MILLAFFMGVILADSVSAAKLVGNLEQGSGLLYTSQLSGNQSLASAFTTGSKSGGYVVSEVKVNILDASSTLNAVAGIYANDGGEPGDKLYDLTGTVNSTGIRSFTAPANAVLNTSTTYFFVLGAGSGSGFFRLRLTDSVGGGSASGWSLSDSFFDIF